LSHPTEHSEESSSLPPPELNPLLNPLLADNMGRWAQVYFTSPPEKREHAVLELLRELTAEKSAREGTGAAASPLLRAERPLVRAETPLAREQPPAPAVSPASLVSQVHTTLVRCRACGRKNPSTQKFCGMCGTHLGDDGETAELHRGHLRSHDLEIADLPAADRHLESSPKDQTTPYDEATPYMEEQESHYISREHDVYEPRLNTNELSLFQSGRDVDYDDDEVILSTPRAGGIRFIVGLVLAIVIGALGYMAWRSSQQTTQSHLEQSSPPVAAEAAPAEPAPAESAPPSSAKTNTADRTPPPPVPLENQAARPVPAPVKDVAKPVPNEPTTKADNTAPTLPHGISRPPKDTPTEASTAKGGGEELAIAQGYLNGTNGQGRNSAEAAKWLWKAIAKHNAEASLLLSDLYLKGEGVSKNCDQARVLLDSATLRGVKDAGVRLRHLQAFGCQ
jgi:hypothetical protein